jgi:hypothetical protein
MTMTPSQFAAKWGKIQAKETRGSVSREEVIELDDIHRALDSAVLSAYGWPADLSDEQLLERLLALNLERASS